jgi:hypothetical protein
MTKRSMPLRVLAVAAAPLWALAVHAAMPGHAAGVRAAHAAEALPHNLCASCHGGGRVVSLAMPDIALDARELAATRTCLREAQGS